jgi:hypothetical protein
VDVARERRGAFGAASTDVSDAAAVRFAEAVRARPVPVLAREPPREEVVRVALARGLGGAGATGATGATGGAAARWAASACSWRTSSTRSSTISTSSCPAVMTRSRAVSHALMIDFAALIGH